MRKIDFPQRGFARKSLPAKRKIGCSRRREIRSIADVNNRAIESHARVVFVEIHDAK